MIWGWLMFSEPITTPAIVGFAICIVGVLLTRPVQRGQNKAAWHFRETRRTRDVRQSL
jgi:hypothetical protein